MKIKTIDHSNFLKALQKEVRQTSPSFDFNEPQDVPEVFDVILMALKGLSPVASDDTGNYHFV